MVQHVLCVCMQCMFVKDLHSFSMCLVWLVGISAIYQQYFGHLLLVRDSFQEKNAVPYLTNILQGVVLSLSPNGCLITTVASFQASPGKTKILLTSLDKHFPPLQKDSKKMSLKTHFKINLAMLSCLGVYMYEGMQYYDIKLCASWAFESVYKISSVQSLQCDF